MERERHNPETKLSPDEFISPVVEGESQVESGETGLVISRRNLTYSLERIKDDPVNPETGADLSPERIREHFERQDFAYRDPERITREGGSTLFTVAGIQTLESAIHDEAGYPEQKFFVAQPVLRSKFVDFVSEGTSTSFVNLCTEQVGASLSEHNENVKSWMAWLDSLGFEKSGFGYKYVETEPKWAEVKFSNHVLKFYYKGLEIGDAVYIPKLPQKTRPPLSISDIGFGYERIAWLLRGGKYFEGSELSDRAADAIKTTALLSGSGLTPGNKAQPYRMRMFSKVLCENAPAGDPSIEKNFHRAYGYWSRWVSLPVPAESAWEVLRQENERNVNSIIITRLKRKHKDVDLNINQSTNDLVIQLRGTSVPSQEVEDIINDLKQKHEAIE